MSIIIVQYIKGIIVNFSIIFTLLVIMLIKKASSFWESGFLLIVMLFVLGLAWFDGRCL